MQHLFVASKKHLVQGCKNAASHSRPATKNTHGVRERYFLFVFYFMHTNAV